MIAEKRKLLFFFFDLFCQLSGFNETDSISHNILC